MPDTLDEAEISYILARADELAKWAGDVKDFALEQALSGTSYPGFKVVEGRSVRKYTDEEAVAFAVKDNGFDPYAERMLRLTLFVNRWEELRLGRMD